MRSEIRAAILPARIWDLVENYYKRLHTGITAKEQYTILRTKVIEPFERG